MAVTISCEYQGDLAVQATHGPSGTSMITDPPTDNGGQGRSFSPTDLVATALGTCVITIMALVGERHGVDLRGARVEVTKEMISDPVRRVGRLPTRITVPPGAVDDPAMRSRLEAAARKCPVHQSLHPDIEILMEFIYES